MCECLCNEGMSIIIMTSTVALDALPDLWWRHLVASKHLANACRKLPTLVLRTLIEAQMSHVGSNSRQKGVRLQASWRWCAAIRTRISPTQGSRRSRQARWRRTWQAIWQTASRPAAPLRWECPFTEMLLSGLLGGTSYR